MAEPTESKVPVVGVSETEPDWSWPQQEIAPAVSIAQVWFPPALCRPPPGGPRSPKPAPGSPRSARSSACR